MNTMAEVLSPSELMLLRAMRRGGNGNGRRGGGGACGGCTPDEAAMARDLGCSWETVRGMGRAALAAWKGGHINDGYASCGIEPLHQPLDANGCPTGGKQCMTRIPLRATAILAGETVIFEITPVGTEAVLREIYGTLAVDGLQITRIFAVNTNHVQGSATSNHAGQLTGYSTLSYARDFRNYAAPSGVKFNVSQHLFIDLQNQTLATIAIGGIDIAYDEVY